ncbi:MAG: type II toxin-antitoxin system HicB family antitoxin [Calditrichota bacterium]
MSLRQFLIVIEKAKRNYAAYSPDLPGCIATGRTRKDVEKNMHEAIQIHVAGLIEDGLPIPPSQASAAFVLQEVPTRRRSGSRSKSPRQPKRT